MKIAIASSEVYPFAKTGGLADVAGALPKALAKLGVETCVVMPLYKVVDRAKWGLKKTAKKAAAKMDGKAVEAAIWEGALPGGVRAFFVDTPKYYDRDVLYGTAKGDLPDNAERFIYFSKIIPEVLKAMDFRPDVIHTNDWQTGLVPLYLNTLYADDAFFKDTGTVFTVHNIGYQGKFWANDWHLTGLGWEYFTPEGLEFYGDINVLKGGLVYSDIINTVSKTYSKEIQTPEFGYGLEGVLKKRAADLYGIVNGIDYEEWDPQTDKHLVKNYGTGDVKGKQANKKGLKEQLNLAAGNKPLFGIISRLADQKGLDLIAGAINDMMKMDLQVVVLGTGEEKYHKLLTKVAKDHPKNMSVNLAFDATLAARIYAASDVFMMPSRYEPCGLGQLISLRYGTVPLVRKTGGLADTVSNYNPKTGKGNGFVFSEYSSKAFLKSVKAALSAFDDKNGWKTLVTSAMIEDNSWDNSAKEYVKLYKKAEAKAKDRRQEAA
ncbi:MAG: glycogen synthase GlgA [Nitrospirota bacterium]